MSARTKPGPEEHVSFECGFCGKKVGAYLSHYGVARCVCGKYHWALRPQRGGPLTMFPHPWRNMVQNQPEAA